MKSLLEREIEALITAGVYLNKEDLLLDAVRALFRLEPQLKVRSAMELFRQGEISISRAAEISGLCLEDIKRLLAESGTPRTIGASSKGELDKELAFLEEYRT